MTLIYNILKPSDSPQEDISGNKPSAALYNLLVKSDSSLQIGDCGLGKTFSKKNPAAIVTAAFSIATIDGKRTVKVNDPKSLATLANAFANGNKENNINANPKKQAICLALIIANENTSDEIFHASVDALVELYRSDEFKNQHKQTDILSHLGDTKKKKLGLSHLPDPEHRTRISGQTRKLSESVSAAGSQGSEEYQVNVTINGAPSDGFTEEASGDEKDYLTPHETTPIPHTVRRVPPPVLASTPVPASSAAASLSSSTSSAYNSTPSGSPVLTSRSIQSSTTHSTASSATASPAPISTAIPASSATPTLSAGASPALSATTQPPSQGQVSSVTSIPDTNESATPPTIVITPTPSTTTSKPTKSAAAPGSSSSSKTRRTSASGSERQSADTSSSSTRQPPRREEKLEKLPLSSEDTIKQLLDKVASIKTDDLKSTKAAQKLNFTRAIEKLSDAELLLLNTHLNEVQHSVIKDERLDTIRKERKFFGHGNTATWQAIRHAVKERLMIIAELKTGGIILGSDTKKRKVPAAFYHVDYSVFNQHSGRFFSHIGSTKSAKKFESMFEPETPTTTRKNKV